MARALFDKENVLRRAFAILGEPCWPLWSAEERDMLLISLQIAIGILVAEVAGYAIHRALHTSPAWFDKHKWARPLKFITVSHMGHHALSYGPRMLQRPHEKYFFVRNPNAPPFTVKYSWLLPEFSVLGVPFAVFYLGTMLLLGLSWSAIIVCFASTLAWVGVTFLYFHDCYHKKNHWLSRVPVIRIWFRAMRRAHDLHHTAVEDGTTPYNLGISLPLVDVVAGTWRTQIEGLEVDEESGQMTISPYRDEDYALFYQNYGLEEPQDFSLGAEHSAVYPSEDKRA